MGTQFHPEATPESARIWARHYGGSLRQVAVDGAALVAATVSGQEEAAKRAHLLTDRVVEHAVLGSPGSA
ncbi:MAG: hypothetical protein GEV09_25690 [Pseudonocardiaceae bacterium]|nr:hypothetical protein [Pseudonocardiaceae bacterium]